MAREATGPGGSAAGSASGTAEAGTGPAEERPVVVRLEGVEKTYGGGVVGVTGADLAIGAGEFLTLLGPSGCGKTTTLRLIAGFERPTAGRITVAGRDVTAAPPYDRPVNTVFQDYALFPHMTVAENVRFGLEVARVPAAEARRRSLAALERVALARAIVNEPKVLLLDEPLAALDAHLREQMQVELKRLQARLGTTFVMVTHDQTEALSISDRIVVMNRGRIEQVADPATLYDRPATRFVAGFIGAMNLVPGRVRTVAPGAALVDAGGLAVEAETIGLEAVPGDRVTLGLRPEDVRVVPAGEGTAARVDGVVFHGRTVRLHLVLADGTAITADLARSSAGSSDLGPGSAVGVVAAGPAKIYPGAQEPGV